MPVQKKTVKKAKSKAALKKAASPKADSVPPKPEVTKPNPVVPMVTVPEDTTIEPPTTVIDTTPKPFLDSPPEVIEEVNSQPPKKNLFWLVMPIALLAGAVVGGLVIWLVGPKDTTQTLQPSPSAAQENVEPSPVLNRADLRLQVLNGSGVRGAANQMKTTLEDLGYVDVATGNADANNYDLTEIAIKDDKKRYVSLLTADLSKEASVSSEIGPLEEDSDFDVVITLGKE